MAVGMPSRQAVVWAAVLVWGPVAAGAGEADRAAEPPVAELVSLLGSEKWAERERAHNALAELGARALAELEGALRSDDSEVFWRALAILGSMGPPAEEALERASSDEAIPAARRARVRQALAGLHGAGYLGVYISGGAVESADGKGSESAVAVVGIIARSPAERVGFKTGDTITRVDGERVRSAAELTAQVRKRRAGTKVKIELVRDGRTRRIEI